VSGRRILVLILGSLAAVIGLFLVALGIVALIVASVADGGYLESNTERLESQRNALVSEDIAADGPSWLFSEDRLTLRVRVESPNPNESVFVGVAPLNSLASYLDGVGYDVLGEIDYPDFDVIYEPVMGARTPAPPANQDFWAAQAEGTGRQEIEWDIEGGNWSVAVLNSDGSRPVVVNASAGLRLAFLTPLGIITIVVGAILLIGGIILIVLGIRKKERKPPPASVDAGTTGTLPPDQSTF
jgi:uncharacterized membrane protein